MPVVFVHGITVRKDRFDTLLQTVKNGFKNERNDFVINGYYWGDNASELNFGGASIPGFLEGRRAIADTGGTMSDPKQLVALLLDDPYLELRILKDQDDFDPTGAGFIPIPAEVEKRNQALEKARPDVLTTLKQDGTLAAGIGQKVSETTLASIVKNAFEAAGMTDRRLTVVDLIDPLSRSITAALYQKTAGDGYVLDADFAWHTVDKTIQKILEDHLGGQRGWIGDKFKNAAMHSMTFAMRHGLRRRIMKSMSIFIGDVLVYMSKRDEILDGLDQTVQGALNNSNTPLWLVGHSLGGIILFDYCCQTNRDIERLITVGSQVGLFGELGTLRTKPRIADKKLETPSTVGKWINMYDPDDILSFCAAPIFTRTVDIEFDTEAPFPVSHSEYWNRSEVYAQLVV